MQIVAIGGGEIGRPGYPIETEAIDREIIRLTPKKRPLALLLPTASGDSPTYWTTFRDYYGKRLNCKTDVLNLVVPVHSRTEIRRRILDADIVYVGGGNTLQMMKIWRTLGVNRALLAAWALPLPLVLGFMDERGIGVLLLLVLEEWGGSTLAALPGTGDSIRVMFSVGSMHDLASSTAHT